MTLYRCTVKGVFASTRTWGFRMHFNSAASLATVEADWLAHITGAWTVGASALQAFFPTTTVLETTKTEQLAVVHFAGPPAVDKLRSVGLHLDNPALAGTSVNSAEADQVAILVQSLTNLPGRENHGKIHLPAPDQTLATAGAISSVTAGKISTAINGVLTNMAGSGHTGVVPTYTVPKSGTPVGSTRNITTWRTDEVLRTVRVRNKRRQAVYV